MGTGHYDPWTNGRAEGINCTIKEATTKAFHHPDLESLKAHVLTFVTAYNFSKHLKALRWKTPFEAVCNDWTKNPAIFKMHSASPQFPDHTPKHREFRCCY
jgi:heme oxygenase